MTSLVGLAIVIVHAWLVFSERFIDNADYSDNKIYYGPMLITLIALPLLVLLYKKLRHF